MPDVEDDTRKLTNLEFFARANGHLLQMQAIINSQGVRFESAALEEILGYARRIATSAAERNFAELAAKANAIELFAAAGITSPKVDSIGLAVTFGTLFREVEEQLTLLVSAQTLR